MSRTLVLALALASGAVTLAARLYPCAQRPLEPIKERWAPEASRSVRSIDEAVALLPATGSDRDIALAADALVRDRFFHGYSQFRFCDNWAAYLASFAWDDLAAPVRGDDILKYRRAACSQQAIVLQEMLRKRGLTTASVRLGGHFVAAVQINGEWMAMDPNQETAAPLFPISALQTDGPMYRWLYRGSWAPVAGATLADIDVSPAPEATFFHQATALFSAWGWLALLALYGLLTAVGQARGSRNRARKPQTA